MAAIHYSERKKFQSATLGNKSYRQLIYSLVVPCLKLFTPLADYIDVTFIKNTIKTHGLSKAPSLSSRCITKTCHLAPDSRARGLTFCCFRLEVCSDLMIRRTKKKMTLAKCLTTVLSPRQYYHHSLRPAPYTNLAKKKQTKRASFDKKQTKKKILVSLVFRCTLWRLKSSYYLASLPQGIVHTLPFLEASLTTLQGDKQSNIYAYMSMF